MCWKQSAAVRRNTQNLRAFNNLSTVDKCFYLPPFFPIRAPVTFQITFLVACRSGRSQEDKRTGVVILVKVTSSQQATAHLIIFLLRITLLTRLVPVSAAASVSHRMQREQVVGRSVGRSWADGASETRTETCLLYDLPSHSSVFGCQNNLPVLYGEWNKTL
jgi:hypothetical protein